LPVLYRWLSLQRLVFISFFLSLLAFLTLSDPDYFWHLRTGEYILTHGALPASDIFSYTAYGRPWVLHEWLFEVVLYAVHQWAGPFGVKLLTASLSVAALYVAYAAARRLLHGSPAAILLSLGCFIPLVFGVAPRPQLATFLFLAVFLYVLLDFKYFRSSRYLFALPVLMALWVNLHGGYIIGIALLGLFVGCEWVTYLLQADREPEQKRRLAVLAVVTLATALASLINPYPAGGWTYPFEVLHMEASQSIISEWQPPNFHDPLLLEYLFLVFLFFAASIYRKAKPDLTELAVPVFFIVASFSAIRHVPLAALVLLPFSAVALSRGLAPGPAYADGLRRLAGWWRRRAGRGGRQLGSIEYLLNWLLLSLICVAIFAYHAVRQPQAAERLNKAIPVAATRFILDTGLTGRMFNTYHFGGYLIYKLYPAQKVFIDGRADLYGDAFVKEHVDISQGKPGWDKSFAKYGIDYVICNRDMPLRQLLLARGDFKLVYDDKYNSVLVRNVAKYAGIIARFGTAGQH
jgi:hypothetical protein